MNKEPSNTDLFMIMLAILEKQCAMEAKANGRTKLGGNFIGEALAQIDKTTDAYMRHPK